tara:strand:+ start:329 stop:862 length:534 start_codon:yes stop_codon:yes gene_type:complete
MSERENQNWERRFVNSVGPKFKVDVGNPQMGEDGENVFLQCSATDKEVRQFSCLTETGKLMLHNEGDIQVRTGKKANGDLGIDIATLKGSIAITCENNGNILIKGDNIIIEAREDIALKAGRNISLSAPQTINLSANRVEASGSTGNIMKAIFHVTKSAGSFVGRVFSRSKVGGDVL